jgi:hypothetical protein
MDPYSDLFANRPSKIAALIYSAAATLVSTPLMYSIVRYERNHHHRTLLNQLISSTFWTAIIWNSTVQPMSIYRFVVGPVHSDLVCAVNGLLRNGLLMNGLLLLDATMVVKYAFLFHTKNPTAIQDDFWNIFAVIWTFGLTLLSQLTYILLPGQSAQNFFICTGKIPTMGDEVFYPKTNYAVLCVVVLSAVIYLFVGTRHLHYKYWVERDTKKENHKKISIFNVPLNTQTLVSFTTHGVIIFLITSGFLVVHKVNKMNIETLSSYPNYFWFYVLHLYSPSSTTAGTVVTYCIKSKPLFNHLKTDCLEVLKRINFLKYYVPKIVNDLSSC